MFSATNIHVPIYGVNVALLLVFKNLNRKPMKKANSSHSDKIYKFYSKKKESCILKKKEGGGGGGGGVLKILRKKDKFAQ